MPYGEYSIRLPRRQKQPCRETVMESQPELLLHYFSSSAPPNKTKEKLISSIENNH